MIRILFALLLGASVLFATHNRTILEMQANIIPKLILMDYNYDEKLVNGTILITVLYESQDRYYADMLRTLIHKSYPDGIQSYKVEVQLEEYGEYLRQPTAATLLFYFESDLDTITKANQKAARMHIITFGYDPKMLSVGTNLSLFIGAKTRPYVNLTSLKAHNIAFRPILTRISKFYE